MTDPVVGLVADRAGFELKNALSACSTRTASRRSTSHNDDPVDYPDMAVKLAGAQGVLASGAGIGISIAANRYPWVRAALCYDPTTARLACAHNDANVRALGARLIGLEVARDCLRTFLDPPFAGGRHARRVARLSPSQP